MTQDAVAYEIERLHQFFEDWFNGAQGRSIEEFSDSLDESFFIVSPRGDVLDKAHIVEVVDSRRGASPVEIQIGNVTIRRLEGEMLISTYEERQIRETESTVISATVGLVPDSSRPGGFRWIFVHESWLQPPEG